MVGDGDAGDRLRAELEAAIDEAFSVYGASCLWWMRKPERVHPGTACAVARSLRREAGTKARPLIERLEDLGWALEPSLRDEARERHAERPQDREVAPAPRRMGFDAWRVPCDPDISRGARFFPSLPDDELGRVLHPLDAAVDKALSAMEAVEPLDAVDLLWVDAHVQPLGALAWAAAGKAANRMPEGIVAALRFRARYQDYQLRSLRLSPPVTAGDLNKAVRAAAHRADRLIAALPRGLDYGVLLDADGNPARPDPDRPETLTGLHVHHGSRKGSWPSSPEIASAMLRERLLPG